MERQEALPRRFFTPSAAVNVNKRRSAIIPSIHRDTENSQKKTSQATESELAFSTIINFLRKSLDMIAMSDDCHDTE